MYLAYVLDLIDTFQVFFPLQFWGTIFWSHYHIYFDFVCWSLNSCFLSACSEIQRDLNIFLEEYNFFVIFLQEYNSYNSQMHFSFYSSAVSIIRRNKECAKFWNSIFSVCLYDTNLFLSHAGAQTRALHMLRKWLATELHTSYDMTVLLQYFANSHGSTDCLGTAFLLETLFLYVNFYFPCAHTEMCSFFVF